MSRRLQEMAFLNKGLTITLRDERRTGVDWPSSTRSARPPSPSRPPRKRVGKPFKPLERVFHYPGGLVDYVKHLNHTKDPIHPSIIGFEVKGETMEVEIAMQWNSSYNESVHSFANTINTHEGGTHEEGFRASLTSVVNKYATEKKLLKDKDDKLSGEDVREGLAAIISIRLREPQFEGQTKGKLGNTEAKSFVQKACNDWIADWFERNPSRGENHHQQGDLVVAGAGRRAQGARSGAPQGCARDRRPARQARRLPLDGPGALRALHRGG